MDLDIGLFDGFRLVVRERRLYRRLGERIFRKMLQGGFAHATAENREELGDREFALPVDFTKIAPSASESFLSRRRAEEYFRAEERLPADEFGDEKCAERARELRHDGAFHA